MIETQEVFEQARGLPRDQLLELMFKIQRYLANSASSTLRLGGLAEFKVVKTGVRIRGRVVAINRKTVKIVCRQDKYGNQTDHDVTWTASPQLVMAVDEPNGT